MRKILVPFDGSDPSKRALQYVVDFARDSGIAVEVHVLNAQQELALYGDYMPPNMFDELSSIALAKTVDVLEKAVEVLRAADIVYLTHPAIGDVAEQVNEAVKRLGCDTVVMGTRGLGSFSGLLLGSVASRVIHEVSVPIVLVK
ncbi:universal stress protein [Pseudomonas sp. B392_1p]|uniref:universal stress protein n=1 Tax=Pseudomonas sp. B392_1p TaxID=3457507 RepID=UPI003FCF9606